MSESLSQLLRRTADEVSGPRVDVAELVARAGARQRRRRLAGVGAAAAVVGAIAVAAFATGGDDPRDVEPAPAPSPTPSNTRPLVYADGATVHVGDETFDAAGAVVLIEVTDDGVVYATEDGDQPRLWFRDGTTAQAIGRVNRWPGNYLSLPERVDTAAAGSLVVWEDGRATGGHSELSDEFVVYDTSRGEEVAQIPFIGAFDQLLHVDDAQVYFSAQTDEPGLHLFRYDLASGETSQITQAALEAEMSTHVRMFATVPEHGDLGFSQSADFSQVGTRLVPTSSGNRTVLTRTDGEEIRLSVPDGYALTDAGAAVSYWLDDDRLVLAAADSEGDIGPVHGDVLVCPLPDGECRMVQRAVTVVGPR